jgi:UDP-glucose 4-epimerase
MAGKRTAAGAPGRARYLVTGGAGYIGSHMVLALLEAGAAVTVIDNLSTGHRAAVPADARLLVADLANRDAISAIVAEAAWDAVFHFAALTLVGDSMRQPFTYLRDNALGGLNLIEACAAAGVRRLVLSSTANLFGQTDRMPIADDAPVAPGSPYGDSKWFLERTLLWADSIHGLRSASLRYFNAAGADPAGRAGEDHRPETHLIPAAIDAALGRRPPLQVFGTDYPTEDGTCIRDYVHVSDLVRAHLRVLELLDQGSVTLNVGTGHGHSVREIIGAVGQVAGRAVPTAAAPRRAGDPARLVADSTRLRRLTGWTPACSDLHRMIETAFAWRLAHPTGYGDPAA